MKHRLLATLGVLITLTLAAPALLIAQPGNTPDYTPPPGALNPAVTQANIYQTICVRGWTATVRPPEQYTEALKREQIRTRHLPGTVRDYQEDHFIPLELGGNPTNPDNLWPQLWAQARRKDQWEYSLNRAVCSGRMSLSDARQKIADPSLWW